MKKLILGTLLSLAFSFSASAVPTPVFIYPNCSFGPTVGECTITNFNAVPVSCNFQASGQTKMGGMLNAFQYTILYPGMTAWARVYANNPALDPIVYLNATAFCNTLY